MGEDVTTEVVVDDGGCTGKNHRTLLHLGWRRSDPLAVTMLLTAEPDHPALPRGQWAMLRDFLRYGLDHATGDGDVRIGPAASRTSVIIELRRPGRSFPVTVPAQQVRDFLDATERLVPSGEERSDLALEQLIERLLRA